MAEFERRKFDLDELAIRSEKSKYPFDELEIGEAFAVLAKGSSISGRVSSENKKGEAQYVTRQDKDSTIENPKTWVVRVK